MIPEIKKDYCSTSQRTGGFLPEGMRIGTSANRHALASVYGLHEALSDSRTLEARATLCDAEHNLHVDLGCMKGVIPRAEGALGIDTGAVRDIALISRVGKPVAFRIVGFEQTADGGTRAICSRKAVQAQCVREFVRALAPGDVIGARVTHLEAFGVFADIGVGLSALMPIDSISVSRIPHPNVRFTPGQDIRAVIRSVDENDRITLSHKELLGTWEQNAEEFEAGQTVPGIVRSIERYGIFVELAPNLAGLAEYTQGIEPGQSAGVYIKSILPERMKIKLVIVDAFAEAREASPLRYFTDCAHIDRWVYSPDCCDKIIESVF